jgi:hypothetical protein
MSLAQQMIETHPHPPGASADLAACIQACFDCAQACTACADACLGEAEPKPLVRCIRINLDCADVCDATGRIVSRLTETDREPVDAVLRACAIACRRCAEECERHAAHMDHCRVCAEACRRCEVACERLIGTTT